MSASLVLGLLRFLPPLIELGLPIAKKLIDDVAGQGPTGSAIADYAMEAIKLVPALQQVGRVADAVEILKRTNDEVGLMIRESRGPTLEERTAQAERIRAREAELDAASKA